MRSATELGRKSSNKKNKLNFNKSGDLAVMPVNDFEKIYIKEIDKLPKL